MRQLTLNEQMEIARFGNFEERYLLSKEKKLFPEVIDYLACHEEYDVIRSVLAKRSDIWSSSLDKMARKEIHDAVLEGIAFNLNTDADTLDYLAEIGLFNVEYGVASNPNTRKDRLALLAKSSHHKIQNAVLLNPNTSKEVREEIRMKNKGVHFDAMSWYDYHDISMEINDD